MTIVIMIYDCGAQLNNHANDVGDGKKTPKNKRYFKFPPHPT